MFISRIYEFGGSRGAFQMRGGRRSHESSTIALVSLFALLIAGTGYGDTVYLKNEDRISGVVTGTVEGKLEILTEYAGPLTIDLEEVGSVVTDKPMKLRLKTGKTCEGILATEDGRQYMLIGDTRRALEISEIESVDPVEPKKEEATPVKKWTGGVDAGMSLRTGHTDTLDATIGLTLMREWTRDTLTFELRGGYAETDAQVSTRQLKGDVLWKHDLKDRLYSFWHGGAEHDPAQRLELRLETDAGLGYDVIQRERRRLSLELGPSYAREFWNTYSISEYEAAKKDAREARTLAWADLGTSLALQAAKPLNQWTWNDLGRGFQIATAPLRIEVEQEKHSKDRYSVRVAVDFEQKLFEKSVLTEKLAWLPELSGGDYRLTSDLVFETPLSDKLSLRLNLNTEYDTDTGNGNDELTNTFIMGMRYAF